jgi:hypothetical protein
MRLRYSYRSRSVEDQQTGSLYIAGRGTQVLTVATLGL